MGISLPPPEHRTIEAIEHHFIGEDGFPVVHRSRLVIQSLSRITSFPYRFKDTETVTVEVLEGGRAGEITELGEGIRSVDIILDQPLQENHRTTVVYETAFDYKTPPPPQFPRAVGALGVERLVMHISFNSSRVPKQLWWAQWDGYSADAQIIPGTEQPVELRSSYPDDPEVSMEAIRKLTNVASGVYGYHWQW